MLWYDEIYFQSMKRFWLPGLAPNLVESFFRNQPLIRKLINLLYSESPSAPIASDAMISEFLNEIVSNPRESTTLRFWFYAISIHNIDNEVGLDRLLLLGRVKGAKTFLSIVPDEIKNIKSAWLYPSRSLIFLINYHREVFDLYKFTKIRSRADLYIENCICTFLTIGYEVSEAELQEICYRERIQLDQGIRRRLSYPPESLFEISLRCCRRERISLGSVPYKLNKVKRKRFRYNY